MSGPNTDFDPVEVAALKPEAVEVAIYREAGANIVDVSQRVKTAIFGDEESQRHAASQAGRDGAGGGGGMEWGDRQRLSFLAWVLRDDARFEVLSDQSTFIAAAVDDVKQAAVLGALLAIAVMWVFLRRLSATLIMTSRE